MLTIGLMTAAPAAIATAVVVGLAALAYPFIRCFVARGIGRECRG